MNNISEYELVAKIHRDADKMYYVYVPKWHENGHEWHKKEHPYRMRWMAEEAVISGLDSVS